MDLKVAGLGTRSSGKSHDVGAHPYVAPRRHLLALAEGASYFFVQYCSRK